MTTNNITVTQPICISDEILENPDECYYEDVEYLDERVVEEQQPVNFLDEDEIEEFIDENDSSFLNCSSAQTESLENSSVYVSFCSLSDFEIYLSK